MKEGKDVLGDPRAAHVIAGAGLCYVGVQSDHGPHVTPEAFAVAAGRIWFVTSFRSVKVRAIRRHPEVGLLMRADGGSLVLSGHAEVLSLWSPREAARLAVDALPALEAVGSYGIRNVPTLLGYALDLCRLPGGALPIDRVLVSVRPGSALLLDPDDVAQAWGGWTLPAPPVERGRAAGHPPAPAAEALDDVPSDVAELLAEPAGATVGWPTDGGPVPLPASWDPTRGTVEVSARALDAVRAHANGDRKSVV